MIEKKAKFKVPHTYVILFMVILIMAALTYVIPAGEFDTVEDPVTGRTLVDADSFHNVDRNPTGVFDLFQSVPNGMKEASSIIFFIFLVGGSFQIITGTGAIEALIGKTALGMRGKERIMIPVFITVFAIAGGTIGLSEEVIVFVPIGIALARALGFDAVTGTAMISLGAACGFSSGFMNPFTVGVAQGVAELPLFSGIAMRIIILVVMVVITSIYVLRYADKVSKDPEKSVVRELEIEEQDEVIDLNDIPKLENQHYLVLLVLIAGFLAIIFGVFKYGWYITEIGSTFLAMGLIGGLLGKLGPSKIAEEFVIGAKSIVFGALVVGIARAILVVMENGFIIDSIINGLASVIQTLPKAISVLGMYIVQVIINFFIPSGSGQAATTMPIMAPLSDLIGVTRQTAVMAYQFGDGFTNSIIPTSASLMGVLSIAKIPYERWVKFLWPLMILWGIMGGIFLLIANAISYGPF